LAKVFEQFYFIFILNTKAMCSKLSIIALCLIVFLSNCGTKIPVVKPQAIDLKEWTLQNTPNSLDTVGVLIAIDKKGKKTRIPVTLEIPTTTGDVVIAEQSKTRDVDVGSLVKFLNVPGLDTSSNTSFNLNSQIKAGFDVNNAQISIPNGNLLEAFNKKSRDIADNIKFLGLENNNVYMIIQTIKSPSVNLTLNKNSDVEVNFLAKIKQIIGNTTNAKVKVSGDQNLVYNLESPLVVFYQLRKINVNAIGSRGSNDLKVDVSVGSKVDTPAL
jgi:hypothetical protein